MLAYFTIAVIVFIVLFSLFSRDDDFQDLCLVLRVAITCAFSLFFSVGILILLLIIRYIICSNKIIWILAYVCICFVAGYILSRVINKGD